MKCFANGSNYYLQIHQNNSDLPYLILFHGFMGSGKAFSGLIDPLSEICNPVTIDLKGHGKTTAKPSAKEFDTSEQIKELHSVIDRLQLPKFFLYGYSMGGRLALQFALENPSSIKGMILESTHCGISDLEERKKRMETDEKRAQEIERHFDKFLSNWTKLPLFQGGSNASSDYLNILKQQNPSLMASSLRGFGAGKMPAVCDQLSTFNFPVGLIAGKNDQKYVEKMTEMAQLCQQSELEIIDNAAHRVHVDQPEKLTQFLKHFIQKHHG
ncbi:MAG: 2-succinyl-6-hydroxy-2,4-cyclohexadiene-1-carboxylate synthase [Balneolaceae bacterium]